jgi:hypothetical protein
VRKPSHLQPVPFCGLHQHTSHTADPDEPKPHLQQHDALDLVPLQPLEHNELVNPVHKLRTERGADLQAGHSGQAVVA